VESRIELKIPSQLVYLGVPDAVLMEVANDLPCERKFVDELSSSVIEACTNAMEHGNGLREDLSVEVHFEFREDAVQVRIFDRGSGFAFQSWQPPTDIMRERGRGILIMKEFTDQLDFSFAEDGRFQVQLLKRYNNKRD
jgi:anti-sigma regulatory factor (Ser/Thr protein kinase)